MKQCTCIRYGEVDSTNRIAKELLVKGAIHVPTVLVAECQSAGRGQHGRTFGSPPGGLYCSIVLTPDLSLESLPLITLATGVACQQLLSTIYTLETRIKWPNDIYLEGKKLAGILCETVIHPQPAASLATVIIGIGLNVNTALSDYAPAIQPLLTTMAAHLGQKIDIEFLLEHICENVTEQVQALGRDQNRVLQQWQQADYLYGQRVVCQQDGQRIHGVAQGLTTQGRYQIVEETGAVHEILAGQIRLLTQDGSSGGVGQSI